MFRLTLPSIMTVLLSLLAETTPAVSASERAEETVGRSNTDTAQDAARQGDDVPRAPVVLVVGASGSIGRLAVAESHRLGYETRALIRDPDQARLFAPDVKSIVGDLTRAETLPPAVAGVTGIIFTHGISGNDPRGAKDVNYGAVRNILSVLQTPAHIALMTTVGVTKPTVGHDWKRRGERLVRASGLPYTIVRPGWFDYNAADQHKLVMRQGDTHWAGSPADGVVSRTQIAQVLVASLTLPSANRKTFELVAERGAAQTDLAPLFSETPPDPEGSDNGLNDQDTLPASAEPARVIEALDAVRGRFR